MGGGVIDSNYRGKVAVMLYNNSSTDLHIRIGQNIAQIIFEQAKTPCMSISDHLQQTNRGALGFGSTNLAPKPYSHTSKTMAVQSSLENNMERKVTKILQSQENTGPSEIPAYLEMANNNPPTPDEDQQAILDDISVVTENVSNLTNKNAPTVPSNHTENNSLPEATPPILLQEKPNSSIPSKLSFFQRLCCSSNWVP